MATMALQLLFAVVHTAAQEPSQGILGVEWKYRGSTTCYDKDGMYPWVAHVKYHVTDFKNDVNSMSFWTMYYFQGDDKTRVCCEKTKSSQMGTQSDSSVVEGTMISRSDECRFEAGATYTFCACAGIAGDQLGKSLSSASANFVPGSRTIKSCSLAVVSAEGQHAKTSVTLDIESEAKDADSPAPAFMERAAKSIVMSSTEVSGTTCDILELTSTDYQSFSKGDEDSVKAMVEGTLLYAVLSAEKEANPSDQPDACKTAWSKATSAQVKVRMGAMQTYPDDEESSLGEAGCTLSWSHNQGSSPAPSPGGSDASTAAPESTDDDASTAAPVKAIPVLTISIAVTALFA